MKIEKTTLTSFRGASNLELEFSDKINVLAGINGAGKSTVLDALAISLSWLINRIQRINSPGRPIPEPSIRNERDFSEIAVTIKALHNSHTWTIRKMRKGKPISKKSDLEKLSQLAILYQEQYDLKKTLPVITYYPVNRVVDTVSPDISGNERFEIWDVYKNSLGGKADFQSFFEWYRLQDDIINEQIVLKTKKFVFENESVSEDLVTIDTNVLQHVKKAIEIFIPNYSNLRIKRLPFPHLLVDKMGAPFDINQLSDGEKNLIALIGDITRRLCMANPEKENPLHGEGIILIDEIDLHLHPNWQRMIIPRLTKVFPNCQFIVSTHSPQILSHVKPENIFLLHQGEHGITVTKPTESYGKNTDRILEDIMGVDARPSEEKQKIHELYVAIKEGNLKKAQNQLDDLRELIGEDPDLVKANVLIKRKEVLGK